MKTEDSRPLEILRQTDEKFFSAKPENIRESPVPWTAPWES